MIDSWNNFNSCLNVKFNKNLQLSKKVNPNIKSIMVFDNKTFDRNYNFLSKGCNKEGCRCCKFMITLKSLKFTKNFSLPILTNSDCLSEYCVYVLFCTKCNFVYIGETSQSFKKRFSAHLSNIKNFIPLEKMLSEVAIHFNDKGHNFLDNLKACVFVNNIQDDIIRKSIESELIHLYLTFGFKVINSKLYFKFNNFCTSV